MPLKNYTNNNDRNITNSTYSSIAFSNPGSKIMQTRFSISYFNKLMKISIALRNNAGTNDEYATYDIDNQVSVYVSFTKAEMLRRMIKKFKSDPSIHNVCIELKNGLLKVSDGAEFGSNNICISISYADETGNVNEVIYECKSDFHTAAYNYSDNLFSTETFNDIEIDSVCMALEQYYYASSYAIAATVMEASMYKRSSIYDLIRSIGEKVGVSSGSKSSFNTKTFLSGNNANKSNGGLNGIPAGYESTTFESIADSLI